MTPFEKAFQDLVKDMYNAEKQVLKALPKAAKASTSPDLKAGIEEHREQTEGHVSRLEQVAELGEFRPSGKVCAAASGIIEEMAEAIEEHPKGPVLDAVLVCGCQKFEHYEISNYGTAIAWARLLGKEDAAKLLEETLNEEVGANDKLSKLATKSINKAALNAAEESKSAK